MITKAKRIVVKTGSSLIAGNDGTLRAKWLASLAEDIAALKKAEKEVIVVSSGAVALGRQVLGFGKTRQLKLEEKQASAACGQGSLIEAYQQALNPYGARVAQVLLTIEDSENRRRYLNARNTIQTLLDLGVVPVINENDTVATNELRFGDNDRLAARVAQMMGADLLVLLSDIDGLYEENPIDNPDAKHVPVVKSITPQIESMAGGAASALSSGGMVTKIMAAKIAVGSGCNTIISQGVDPHPLRRLEKGGQHTLFQAEGTPKSARKRWIADMLAPAGEISVDAGAATALKKGRSLLPAGVTGVKGEFARGDVVIVRNPEGEEIARGIVAYSAKDAAKILGLQTDKLEEVLGFKGREEVIHRDDLALL